MLLASTSPYRKQGEYNPLDGIKASCGIVVITPQFVLLLVYVQSIVHALD